MSEELTLPLDEYSEARAARNEAMDRVDSNADPDWKDLAIRVTLRVALAYPEFTTDDVWEALGEERPHEPRALGPIMALLSRSKVIRKTGMMRESKHAQAHMRPKAVWTLVQ
jgi:hypothetical protein